MYTGEKPGEIATPDLKLSNRKISLRLAAPLLESLKVLENKRDVPYQSWLEVFPAERVEQELRLEVS